MSQLAGRLFPASLCLLAALSPGCGPELSGFQFLGEVPGSDYGEAPMALEAPDGSVLVTYRGRSHDLQKAAWNTVRLSAGGIREVGGRVLIYWSAARLTQTSLGPVLATVNGDDPRRIRVEYRRLEAETWELFAHTEAPPQSTQSATSRVVATADPLGNLWMGRSEASEVNRFRSRLVLFRDRGEGFERVGDPIEDLVNGRERELRAIEFDPSGRPFLLIESGAFTDTSSVLVMTLNESGQWGQLGEEMEEVWLFGASLTFDREGVPHLVTLVRSPLLRVFRWTGPGWHLLGTGLTVASYDWSLSFDGDNVPHLVRPMEEGAVLSRLGASGWEQVGGPLRATDSSGPPRSVELLMREQRSPIVLWSEPLPGAVPMFEPRDIIMAAELTSGG